MYTITHFTDTPGPQTLRMSECCIYCGGYNMNSSNPDGRKSLSYAAKDCNTLLASLVLNVAAYLWDRQSKYEASVSLEVMCQVGNTAITVLGYV